MSSEPGAAETSASAAADVAHAVADVTVEVHRSQAIGVSRLALGVTHTQHSADSWNSRAAVERARDLLRNSVVYQNQHVMGWGADNPEPSPGVYDWSTLDERMRLIRQTGGTPVITLCGAPDWMKGGQPGTTDWSKIEVAPRPEHFADFAELSRRVAERYPDVRYFQVWNELKGFWNAGANRWDYEGYTALYNAVYDAVKSVRPDAQLGGPYVVMDSWSDPKRMSHPSKLSGPYGTIDQRVLDVITYWLEHKRGAEFITLDATIFNKDKVLPCDEFAATQKFSDVAAWVKQRTDLPLWWAEWYATPWGEADWDHARQNAVMTAALMAMARSGAAVPLRWQPQGVRGAAHQGNVESLWSDTRSADGGQPFPAYRSFKALHDFFAPGTPLVHAQASGADVEVLASDARTLLVNKRAQALTVAVNGEVVSLDRHEVKLL